MPDINTEKVCFVIAKAREFDVKVGVVEPNPGGSPIDGEALDVLQDYAEDPTYQEIKVFIDGLNEDEQIDLVALTWLGRGDYGAAEWDEARAEAQRARDEHGHTADYLLGAPLLGDYLEEGLAAFNQSCEEYETGRL
jgi:hypothetical protein